MITIDKEILQDIQSEYPHIKRQDIKQYLWDVHPMGTPSFIMLYTGHWETTSQLILKRIYLDEKFRRIDEPIEYDRGDNATIEFYDRKEGEEFPNLQEELEYLSIRAYRFASDEQHLKIREFRYRWVGLLDRYPPMLDVKCLMPTESTTDDDNIYYELRSQDQENKFHNKFNELMELSDKMEKEMRYPIGCPPMMTRKNWKKPIYLLVKQYKDKYWGKDWVNGEITNICKFLSIKYTFNGEWKHPKNILDSYSQAKQRTSKIVK